MRAGTAVASGAMDRRLPRAAVDAAPGAWLRSRQGAELIRGAFHGRLTAAQAVSAMLPTYVGGCAVRARMYRWAGFDLEPGVAIVGKLTLSSSYPDFYGKLSIGAGSTIGHHVAITLDAKVTIGRNVGISPYVVILTGNHAIGPGSARMSNRLATAPVTIGDGAWVRAGALIVPGISIGQGSIVAAGAVVLKDVPPNTYVEGNPAVVAQRLPWGDR